MSSTYLSSTFSNAVVVVIALAVAIFFPLSVHSSSLGHSSSSKQITSSSSPCQPTCAYALCDEKPLLLRSTADTPLTSAICKDGQAIGVANAAGVYYSSASMTVPKLLTSMDNGLPETLFKTLSLANTSAAIAHQVIQPDQFSLLHDKCIIIPLTTVQIFSEGSVINVDYDPNDMPLINCVSVKVVDQMQPKLTPPLPSPTSVSIPTPDAGSSSMFKYTFDSLAGIRLEASEVQVRVPSGRVFVPNNGTIEVSGDPSFPTLELKWKTKDGIEMRINFYFDSNETHWYIEEVRTYNGLRGDKADWLSYFSDKENPLASTPFNQAYTGDIIIGTLTMRNVRLQAYMPQKSSCVVGAGLAGDVVLERLTDQPVQGVYYGTDENEPIFSTGFAFTLLVRDAVTCELLNEKAIKQRKIIFRAFAQDSEIVSIDEVIFEKDRGETGELYVSINFDGVGSTSLAIRAIERRSVKQLGRLVVPVNVESG